MSEREELIKRLDDLIDSARHLGSCEARKETGNFTERDFRFCSAMYQSISKHRTAISAAITRAADQVNAEGKS